MVGFQTKNPNFGKFLKVFAMENVGKLFAHLVYFTALEIFYGHLVYFLVIWYIFPRFGMLYQEKSGSLAPNSESRSIGNMDVGGQ
jgi:hypothetical protein